MPGNRDNTHAINMGLSSSYSVPVLNPPPGPPPPPPPPPQGIPAGSGPRGVVNAPSWMTAGGG